MNDNDEKLIKTAIEASGFPLERMVRKKLKELNIDTQSTQYIIRNEAGEGVSNELDVFGRLKHPVYSTKDKRFSASLNVRLVGEVKKFSDYSICFYDLDNEKPENFGIRFPNLLNSGFSLQKFLGGDQLLLDFKTDYGSIPFSKIACVLEPKRPDNKPEIKAYENKGNKLIFETASNLALACEYFHKREFLGPTDNYLIYHACFPVFFTDAKLIRIVGEENIQLEEVDNFIYLLAARDLDKIPLTAKEMYYLPILVTNVKGIESAVDLIRKIDANLVRDIETLMERPNCIDSEFKKYKELYERMKK
ncbi:MAG: hypothetical protein WC861_00425 [Candidatus Micrarchaeia archaeon]